MVAHFNSCATQFDAEHSHDAAMKLLGAADQLMSRRSELPRSFAIRVLSTDDVLSVDHHVTLAMINQADTREQELGPLRNGLKDYERLYDSLSKKNAERAPDDQRSLMPTIERAIESARAMLPWLEQGVQQTLGLHSVADRTAEVRINDAKERAEFVRSNAATLAAEQYKLLNTSVQLARWTLLTAQGDFPPALKDAVLDEKGSVRALTHLLDDIDTAFRSTVLGEVIRNDGKGNIIAQLGRPLDNENQQVLEAAISRLGEFSLAVEDLRAGLIEHSGPTHLHGVDVPDLLTKISEEAWFMASTLSKRLELDQTATSPSPLPTAQQAAASFEVTLPQAAAGSSTKRRANSKGKAKARRHEQGPVASAGTAAGTARPAAGTSAAASPPAAKKQVVRSKLGTPMLVSAEEAAKAAAAAEAAKQRLQNLDELLGIDVSARQRALAHARDGVSPENGTYAVEQILREIEEVATAMKACLTRLEDPKERRKLAEPGQLPQVHAKLTQLQNNLSQLEGLTNAAKKNLEAAELEHVKTYRLPRQGHIERLLREGQLAPIGKPQALEGNPGTLFEVKLQPLPLRNGVTPKPIWLHIHTEAPVHAHQLTKLDDTSFGASHLKNDEERHRGRKWQNARAAEGYEQTMIHRGKVSPKFFRELLGGR